MAEPLPAKTLVDYFDHAATSGKSELLISKVDGKWTPVSAGDFARLTKGLSLGLASLGVDRGDRVAILSENRPEWAMTDFACLALGAMTVPIYTTYLAPQVEYILKDCEAKVVVVSPAELGKVMEVRARCPHLHDVVVVGGVAPDAAHVVAWDAVARRGEQLLEMDRLAFDERVASVEENDFATIIYTSGTTGEPKGAVLSHGNFVSNVKAVSTLFDIGGDLLALSFLPLSHVFERMVDYFYFSRRLTIAYAESIDKLSENFGELRPHVFAAVPRVYEKMLARVTAAVEQGSALKRTIFDWGVKSGKEKVALVERHRDVPGFLDFKVKVADKLVFSKIKARLGGRFRFAISGGAPLAPEVAQFFWGADVKIYEGYGLTETSPVLTCNHPGDFRLGTVGRPIRGVSIALAEDG
ncbi:MAG TPA: AMP-binding protein, partial [Thermoanaerobaculia bacterium]|nr:AMP-binding protein [Thermoanaerobaculia bacterium]